MKMNILNDVYLDTYILHIIIRQKLEKLAKILKQNLILKIYNFQSKLEIFGKLKKRVASLLVFFVVKLRKNIQRTFKRHVDFLLMGEESKRYYILVN